jgi:hypothetical protein
VAEIGVSEEDGPVIDAAFAPARGDAVYTVTIDGEAVLLDEAENRLHHLNRTAALLWACFDGEATVAELADDISDELQLDRTDVLQSSLSVVRELGAEGLIAGIQRTRPEDDG